MCAYFLFSNNIYFNLSTTTRPATEQKLQYMYKEQYNNIDVEEEDKTENETHDIIIV